MDSVVHQLAAKGFDISSDVYESGRPEYPIEAVDFLIKELELSTGKVVADFGAGTGKLTGALRKSHARILAIEPIAGMRKKFSSLLPEIEILEGTAEKIPLAAEFLDAMVVAQAFHWFNGEFALKEIFRVLKRNAKLGLIWNSRDEDTEWVAQLTNIIDVHQGSAPRYRSGEWRKAFDTSPLFSGLRQYKFNHVQVGTVETIVDRVASISFIASLALQEKENVLVQVSDLLKNHPQTRDFVQIQLPYRTDVFICQKI